VDSREINVPTTWVCLHHEEVINRVGFEALTAVVINVAIFRDISPCSSYVKRRFGGINHSHFQGKI
jgi:hypothetical protein